VAQQVDIVAMERHVDCYSSISRTVRRNYRTRKQRLIEAPKGASLRENAQPSRIEVALHHLFGTIGTYEPRQVPKRRPGVVIPTRLGSARSTLELANRVDGFNAKTV